MEEPEKKGKGVTLGLLSRGAEGAGEASKTPRGPNETEDDFLGVATCMSL